MTNALRFIDRPANREASHTWPWHSTNEDDRRSGSSVSASPGSELRIGYRPDQGNYFKLVKKETASREE
jgi:hypothetical protein